MSLLQEITPRATQRIIDLVSTAGVDVSDWKNFDGKEPAKNPKYCYEWAFVEAGKVVVLNLWLDSMREDGGSIVYKMNLRDDAKGFSLAGKEFRSKSTCFADGPSNTNGSQAIAARPSYCVQRR